MTAADTRAAGTTPRFRPEIEGLRAVAVTAVVLYHAGVPGLAGGFVGVDVFFVISGYLITELLLRERETAGRLALLDFCARRARRLAPAGLVAVTAAVALHAGLTAPHERGQLLLGGLTAATFTSDLYFGGPAFAQFDPAAARNPVLHTWSLGVEAQYYLVWPLLLSLLAGRRAWLLGLIAAICAVSFAASVALTPTNLPLAFYGPPARLWELGVGAALAVWPPRLTAEQRAVLGLGGLLAIGLAAVLMGPATPFPGWIAAWPVLAAAGVLLGSREGDPANVLLAAPPLQAIGRLSYGWYLWHWPLLTLLDRLRPGAGLPERAGVAVGALAVATASFYLIEQPVRRSVPLAKRPGASLALCGAGMAAACALIWLVASGA